MTTILKRSNILVIRLISLIVVTYASEAERRLRHALFSNYDSEVRPVRHEDKSVNLTMQLALFQIIKLSWNDTTLRWDPTDFEGIKQLNLLTDKVWLPDIVLYNSVIQDNEVGGHLDKLNTRAILYHTGELQWMASAYVETHCDIQVKYFPFDSQHCELKFLSWTYPMNLLDMYTYNDVVDTANYHPNSEWVLTGTRSIRVEKKYSCCEHAFVELHFTIDVSRRSLFYILNLVFPISIITMLSTLCFLLPAESGERISLAVTLLLAVTVFMLTVADVTPATSEETPLVLLYFIISTVDIVILMITICYVNRLHHKEKSDGPMGPWTRRYILENLSFIVGIQMRPCEKKNSLGNGEFSPRTYLMRKASKVSNQYNPNGCNNDNPGRRWEDGKISTQNDFDVSSLDNILSKDTRELAKMLLRIETKLSQRLDKLVEKADDEDRDDLIKVEWRIVAMTVDRCLLYFFIFNFIVTLIAVFSLSPGYVH